MTNDRTALKPEELSGQVFVARRAEKTSVCVERVAGLEALGPHVEVMERVVMTLGRRHAPGQFGLDVLGQRNARQQFGG